MSASGEKGKQDSSTYPPEIQDVSGKEVEAEDDDELGPLPVKKDRKARRYGVLSDRNIHREIIKGDMIINPFDDQKLNDGGYTLSLGSFFFRPRTEGKAFTIGEKSEDYYGKAQEDKKIIRLDPGETILGHSDEFVGTGKKAVPVIQPIHSCGLLISSRPITRGTIMRIPLQLHNAGNVPLLLLVGKPIAKIIFFSTDRGTNVGKRRRNKDDLIKIMSTWAPTQLLKF